MTWEGGREGHKHTGVGRAQGRQSKHGGYDTWSISVTAACLHVATHSLTYLVGKGGTLLCNVAARAAQTVCLSALDF